MSDSKSKMGISGRIAKKFLLTEITPLLALMGLLLGFFAVMITDVILLDTFNTLGLPTSTTVSIVFELLGAAVAISMIKVMNDTAIAVNQL